MGERPAPPIQRRGFKIMSAFQRFARRAVLAAVAVSTLTAIAGAASAEVKLARSECRGGVWHVRTYDITDPNKWVLLQDDPTEQRCYVPTPEVPGEGVTSNYRFQPSYEMRPTLHYQLELTQPQRQEPVRPIRIPLKYAF
jgi:hypothetical protein